MKKHITLFLFLAACALRGQQNDIVIKLQGGAETVIAVPDLRGAGAAQTLMAAFNTALLNDLQDSGYVKIAPRSLYPLQVPQQATDFRPPTGNPPVRQGPWLTDWSAPPVSASYLAIGYTAEQNGRLVLLGWLYDVRSQDLTGAQVFTKRYFADVDEAGARSLAHQFAADILARFGATSLFGTKIYFTSTRTGNKEIWVMDHDGANQRQVTKFGKGAITNFVGVSADGSRIGFTHWQSGPYQPRIMMMAPDTARLLSFRNQPASTNGHINFTPDGKRVLFSSSAAGACCDLYTANVDGSGFNRLTYSRAIDVEPKVNPKTGQDVLFVSGRAGLQQVYRMGIDGSNVALVSPGSGEAANPAWHPDGQIIAFKWTKGYDPGNYNIFIMDLANPKAPLQLTRAAGKNENPSWAPDGRHLVFSSTRNGSTQIYTMLADGTNVRQLTTQGSNEVPVWSK